MNGRRRVGPTITDPRSVYALPMFGRVMDKEQALRVRETLLGYRILAARSGLVPKIHMATGPLGSVTIGIQFRPIERADVPPQNLSQ